MDVVLNAIKKNRILNKMTREQTAFFFFLQETYSTHKDHSNLKKTRVQSSIFIIFQNQTQKAGDYSYFRKYMFLRKHLWTQIVRGGLSFLKVDRGKRGSPFSISTPHRTLIGHFIGNFSKILVEVEERTLSFEVDLNLRLNPPMDSPVGEDKSNLTV